MATLQDAQAPYLTLTEQAAAPSTPAAGDQRLYTKTDGKLYRVDDAGTETEIGAGGGGGATLSIAQAYRSAALSVASGSLTAIPWDAEDFDADGFHDTSTNPERFTVPTGMGGTYRIAAQVSLDGNSGGSGKECSLGLYKNAASYAWSSEPILGSQPMSVRLDVFVPLAAGDYVDLRMYQNGGSSVALYTTADRRYCRFALERVA